MRHASLASFLFLALICGSRVAQAQVPITHDGRPTAVVAIAPDAGEWDKLAAATLIEYVEKISGAKLEQETVAPTELKNFIRKTQQSERRAIVVGSLATPQMQRSGKVRAREWGRGTLFIETDDGTVFLGGVEEGPLYAVCELLEGFGVRWFMPGPLGTVIPQIPSLTVRERSHYESPSFVSRWFQMPNKDWQVLNRCGGPYFPAAHGLDGPSFKTEPECFALIKGERSPRQHCLSNPKTLELVVASMKKRRASGKGGPIIGMGPNDGRGFCECEHCEALDGGDYDPFSGDPSVTDRYIWFFNQALEKLNADYPDTKIAFYIYHTYMRPPVKHKPDPRIMGAVAPIALDRVHGFSNPIAPEKSYARSLYEAWGKLIPEMYDRGYWSNLACPGFPFIIVDRLRDEIPKCHEYGLKGWRVETFPNYAAQLPSNYIAAKLMWNHKADVDALLEDFADKFFGPAAKPMLGYVKLMDGALRDSPHITGCSWDMPHHYPPEVRKQARKLLDEAAQTFDKMEKLTPSEREYLERIRVVTGTFDMLEAFIGMLEHRAAGDFVAAKADLDRLDGIATPLMEMQPVPMVSAGRFSTYVNYMKRFYRPCTEQGYARVTGGNKLVAVTPDEWDFLIDPPHVGESIGLYKPEVTGGQWQKIKTSSSSWSNQGLRYYKGMAWYRTTLDVPTEFKGKRMFLWCGGIDEKCKAWVNGKPVGISPGAAFSPFEFDATEAVQPGKNVIVFAVNNDVVNELGTGGLVAPVMLYAPAKGKDAQLENIRPLGETFP